jgi:hypothetical protein
MYEWLEAAAEQLALGVGDDPAGYRLDRGEIERVLELAGFAAHEGGHRTNAPLLCYLVGVAQARHPELDLRQVVAAAVGNHVAA